MDFLPMVFFHQLGDKLVFPEDIILQGHSVNHFFDLTCATCNAMAIILEFGYESKSGTTRTYPMMNIWGNVGGVSICFDNKTHVMCLILVIVYV